MIYIGTSGYLHQEWRGLFYPEKMPQGQWLEYYSRQFRCVEVTATFYNLPASPVFRHWYARTPKDFRFVLKGSRDITHRRRLENCHELLAEFLERASQLDEKLAGVLWQLPPKFSHDLELLHDFLAEVERVQVVYGKFRQAFEFQDISWFEDSVYAILKNYNAAVVMADWPFNLRISNLESRISDDLEIRDLKFMFSPETTVTSQDIRPSIIHVPITADFFNLRLYGPAAAEPEPYSAESLQEIAEDFQPMTVDRDLYAFFNNKTKAHAVHNALQLSNYLKDVDNRKGS